MNKKFSTLVGCLLLGTAFSVNAQNLPKWYGATEADFKDPVAADFAADKVQRFDLSSVLAPGTNGRYVYNNPLNDVVVGMTVAFDHATATANVAPGTKLTALSSAWENITTPVYGDFNGGLGIVPSIGNKAEFQMVINTNGLSNPTNIEFDIMAAKKGAAPNRTIDWTISAKAYDLDGNASADLKLAGIYASGQQQALATTQSYKANNAAINAGSSLKIRINEADNGAANSLANKVIIVKITNANASVADTNESQDKLEPITVIKDLRFDYQRPEVTFSESDAIGSFTSQVTFANEFNAGAGYIAEDMLYTRVEFFNPSTFAATAANVGIDAVSVYKLDVKYPFDLDAAEKALAFNTVTSGDVTTYYFEMNTTKFPVHPTYNGQNGNKKYVTSSFKFKFAPDEVKDFDAAKYIQGSVTAINTSFADAILDATSVPSFVITPSVLAFDEYNQTLSADITVKNLPLYGAGEWIVNQTKNSMKPLQPYCEVADPAFKGYLGTTLVTNNVANTAFATTFLDASGNLLPAYDHVKVYIDYKRGNVSTELNQSVNFQEVFRLNEALTYTSPKGTTFNYTGKDLVEHKLGAIYPNDLKVTGNNQYVWFSYGSNGSVAEAMGLPDGQEFNGHYTRYFYAPFEAQYTDEQRSSRVDTIFIHTAHLVPDASNKAIIKFAIHPVQGQQASNDFRYKAGDAYGIDVAYFIDPVSHNKIAANQNFRGGANTDTLYYVIDLNNEAMVKAVKEKGLELNMKYIADTETWSELGYNGAEDQTFSVTTADLKGDNIFYARGLTDRGVTTNIYDMNYKDWYQMFVNPGMPNTNIFEDQFRNNYGTHYINTCVAADSSSFIVAGINLIDPVKIVLKSNEAKSFVYVQNEVSKDWGTFDANTMTITPNKYGEIYAKIDVKFAPTKNTHALDSVISEKKYTKPVFRKFIYEDIALSVPARDDHFATKFYGNGPLIHQTVDTLFHQRDNMGANIIANTNTPSEFVSYLFEDAGFDYQADSIYSVIYGDAKKPAVKFVDAKGVTIDSLAFGKTYFGTKVDSTIYMVGTELPFEDLTWPVEVASTINFSNSNTTIYPTKSEEFSIFAESDTLGYKTIVPVKLFAQPSVATPCDTETELAVTVPVLCNVAKTIPATFVPALHAPGYKAFAPGDIQGDRANLTWIPEFKEGEVEHTVTIGIRDYNKKTSSIFMSEVYSNGNKMLVELFNGTGTKLNADIFSVQSPNYYLVVEEAGVKDPIFNAAVIANDVVSNKILDPYGCVAKEFVYAFKPNTLYTVTLKQGNIAMDQFQFSTSATHMGRRDDLIAAGQEVTEANDPYRQGKYDQSQWTNTNTWNMGLESGVVNFAEVLNYNQSSEHATAFVSKWDAAKSSMPGLYDGTHIQGLHNNVTYQAWVKPALVAGMDCVKDENVDVLEVKVATSDSKLNGGNVIADITFDYATANEDINSGVSAVTVVGSNGKVIVNNAAGKTVVVSDILGRQFANTVLSTNNAEISAPAGVVVVAVEGEAAAKVIVK